jgi:serine/threonine-protein kinase
MTQDTTNPGTGDENGTPAAEPAKTTPPVEDTPAAEVPKPAPMPGARAAAPADIPQTGFPAPAPQTGLPVADGNGKPHTTVTSGTLIMGTYEIEKLINSGGMGEVYRGRNIHNGEPVAIKIVLPSLAHDPKIVALFQKESTTLSRLSHEAIVRYHVFTVDPTIGRPCMVMEFVSGTALADRLEQGPMPAEDVKVMLRRVASGLDKAHRAGVVHRDLSPDNVILEEGSVEHAKLIDFGIAKSTKMGAGTLLQGQFAGKFNWVSPEQLGAYGGNVDGRSDIYSLALVTAAASRGAVLQMGASIVDAVGKRSGVPDLAGVDPELVPLLSWMLQPDPDKRPESMARVIQAIDNPALIPVAATPAVMAPDPNRTVIGGSLPLIDLNAPTPVMARPVSAAPQTAPPIGATVIASGPIVAEEPEDFSPFGAPGSAKAAAIAAPAPVAAPEKKGKGGLVAALAVLVVAGGGAGAYFGGVFDPKPGVAVEAPEPVAQGEAPAKPVETATAEPEKPAEEPVAETPAVEPVTAEDTAAAEAKAAEENAAAEAKAAEEKAATEKAAAEKAAADKLAAEKAAADAKAAETKAAEEKAAAEAEAAKQAEAKAAEEAAATKADPLARQQAFFDSFAAPDCVHLRLTEAKATGFALNGFALDTKPLEDMAAAWKAATETTPDVAVHLIDEPQCPILDFASRHQADAAKPVTVKLTEAGEVVKSGGTVSGVIEGLEGRPFALFLVSETGGASNLKDWISTGSDGTASFKFSVTLAKGAPPAPQLLLVIATDTELAKLAAVPNGVTAKSLMPFVDVQLKDAALNPTTGLGFFRLEN